MELLAYLKTLPVPGGRAEFAKRCGTTLGHMNNVAYGYKPCGADLAVAIERESEGEVVVETLCPGVDWSVIRGASAAA